MRHIQKDEYPLRMITGNYHCQPDSDKASGYMSHLYHLLQANS